MNLFTDKEQQIIQSDYRRLCNLHGGADDVEESNSMMLTEHPLDTMKNEDLPQNCMEKSFVLAPYNSH